MATPTWSPTRPLRGTRHPTLDRSLCSAHDVPKWAFRCTPKPAPLGQTAPGSSLTLLPLARLVARRGYGVLTEHSSSGKWPRSHLTDTTRAKRGRRSTSINMLRRDGPAVDSGPGSTPAGISLGQGRAPPHPSGPRRASTHTAPGTLSPCRRAGARQVDIAAPLTVGPRSSPVRGRQPQR